MFTVRQILYFLYIITAFEVGPVLCHDFKVDKLIELFFHRVWVYQNLEPAPYPLHYWLRVINAK